MPRPASRQAGEPRACGTSDNGTWCCVLAKAGPTGPIGRRRPSRKRRPDEGLRPPGQEIATMVSPIRTRTRGNAAFAVSTTRSAFSGRGVPRSADLRDRPQMPASALKVPVRWAWLTTQPVRQDRSAGASMAPTRHSARGCHSRRDEASPAQPARRAGNLRFQEPVDDNAPQRQRPGWFRRTVRAMCASLLPRGPACHLLRRGEG